jgi:hypothetical protein
MSSAKEMGRHIPEGHFVMHVTTEIVFSVRQEKKQHRLPVKERTARGVPCG